MNNPREFHFTAEGLRTQHVEIAPESEFPHSKRYATIETEDQNLDRNLGELEEGTKARNRAYQKRLDEVWSRTSGWRDRLKAEKHEMVRTITRMREEYDDKLQQFTSDVLQDVADVFDKFDNELVPKLDPRLDTIEANLDEFVQVKVPEEVERQSGEVSRRLKKAYERFDVEKRKEAKREQKIVVRASNHMQTTAQRFKDEMATMRSKFYILETDILEETVRANRMHTRRHNDAVDKIVELRRLREKEAATRQTEDVDVLAAIVETQILLQKVVLEHFGDTEKGEGGPIFPKFNKLNQRLAKKAARDQLRRESAKSTASEGLSSVL
jgi:hypothetical protein